MPDLSLLYIEYITIYMHMNMY